MGPRLQPRQISQWHAAVCILCLTACAAGRSSGLQLLADDFTPGAHAPQPQVVKSDGAVLSRPVMQPVFFDDPNQQELQSFCSNLATSTYWPQVTAEYGIMGLTVAAAISEPAGTWPSHVTDGALYDGQPSDIETLLTQKLDGPGAPWGVPTSDSVYVLFMPAGVTVSPDSGQTTSACAAHIVAWHTAMHLSKSNLDIAYVVVPNCGPLANLDSVNSRTLAASHAIVGAATNPLLNGYNNLDTNHLVWGLAAGGGDVGAACLAQQFASASLIVTPSDLGYAVQRSWSNVAAAAGHAPCVPAPAGTPYFDAVPRLHEAVQGTLSANPLEPQQTTLGVQVPVGSSQDVELQLFSDAVADGPWNVESVELGSNCLTLSQSASQGTNGDKVTLHIVATSATATSQEVVRVISSRGNVQNSQYLLVHN